MAGCSNYVEQNFLDWYYRQASWLASYTPYVRLFTAGTDWEGGTSLTELSGSGYVQYGQAAARGSTNWNNPASQGNGYRLINKAVDAAFKWTAGANWSAITAAAIYDGNLVGSNLLWGKALDNSRTCTSGQSFRLHNGSTGLMQFDIDTTAAAGITNTAKQALLNHLFISDQSANRVPATAYVRLYTSATAMNLYTGASGTEVSGGGYAAQAVTSSSIWNAASSNGTGYRLTNTAMNMWSAASAAWGTIRYAALVDSGGTTFYAIDQLASDVVIDNGDTFSIGAGSWIISLDESN